MLTAEVKVDFLMCHLVATHHHRGAQAPGKQVVALGKGAGNVFFGGKIKGGTAEFVTFGERHIARRKMRRGFYNF